MNPIKTVSAFVLLCVISAPIWSREVNLCKVTRSFDEKDLGAPAILNHEDCSGVAFYDYAKDLVKASCWPGAIELLDGKCEFHNQKDSGNENKGESLETESTENPVGTIEAN